MANFFELLGFDSNDMADAMPEKIVQVGTAAYLAPAPSMIWELLLGS